MNVWTQSTLWLPTSRQIAMASERAILSALDANLQLAVRALIAEYPMLGGGCLPGQREELTAPDLALVQSMLVLAGSLREVITGYCDTLDQSFKDEVHSDPF